MRLVTEYITMVPKGHGMGKFRLITDLSSHGASMNNGIDADLGSLCYMPVDHVAEMAVRLGQGALLTKMDISISPDTSASITASKVGRECLCKLVCQ